MRLQTRNHGIRPGNRLHTLSRARRAPPRSLGAVEKPLPRENGQIRHQHEDGDCEEEQLRGLGQEEDVRAANLRRALVAEGGARHQRLQADRAAAASGAAEVAGLRVLQRQRRDAAREGHVLDEAVLADGLASVCVLAVLVPRLPVVRVVDEVPQERRRVRAPGPFEAHGAAQMVLLAPPTCVRVVGGAGSAFARYRAARCWFDQGHARPVDRGVFHWVGNCLSQFLPALR
ncbi:targeting protein for Xklp2 isoform X1 [Babesia caballi]|uniref:Targeting protein for Xklp2 isoform X1 n=1 Tax=Babesia caballi TaxID=5871 RepID=A0AAV4LTS5_BABCB|nr:targeting protein for Xklp2 isoform X1 [Babesia caballi]